MEKEHNTIPDLQTCRLSEYLNRSNVTHELLDIVKAVFSRNNRLKAFLISVDEKNVISLPGKILTSTTGLDTETSVDVVSYESWKTSIVDSFAYGYDSRRFLRSTELSTLRRKVSDHQRYSFVAHKREEQNTSCLLKYDFYALDAEAKYIMTTQKEITQSLEHDVLTGGLNRSGLLRELQSKFQAITAPDQYSLIYFNIQNFRMINELYGDEVGDKVLQFMYTSIVYSDLHPLSYARVESENYVCLVDNQNGSGGQV